MSSPEPMRVTCAACGLLCDDLTAVPGPDGRLRLEPACPLGEAWFGARIDPGVPVARVDGREAGVDEALDAAAAILAGARAPLVYGLGQTSIEAQRAAVALADALGATIDPAGPLLDGAAGRAFSARGASTAMLGDIRDRAEVVVLWRADPATTHPRLLERLRLPAEGRTLVVVDAERTATAEQADVFLAVPADRDVEALGRCARSSAMSRSPASRRPRASTTSRRGCATAPTARSSTTSGATSPRSRWVRSSATSTRARTSSRPCSVTRATPPGPRTSSPGRPATPRR